MSEPVSDVGINGGTAKHKEENKINKNIKM